MKKNNRKNPPYQTKKQRKRKPGKGRVRNLKAGLNSLPQVDSQNPQIRHF